LGLSVVVGLSAAVTFHEKIPLTKSWPQEMAIKTDSPDAGNNGVSCDGQTMVSQSITPQENITLSDLWFPYKLTDPCPAGSLEIRVQEIPGGQPVEYAAAPAPLLRVSNPVDLDVTTGDAVFMNVSFDDEDRIELQAGKTYVIEIASSVARLTFYRRGADYYSLGTAYLNRRALQFGQDRFRDIILAVASGPGAEVSSKPVEAKSPPKTDKGLPQELDTPIWPATRWTEIGATAAH